MTNPKTRKTGKASSLMHRQNSDGDAADADEPPVNIATTENREMLMPADWTEMRNGSSDEADGSLTPTPTDNHDEDEDGADEEDTCSSFSLQECFDELHTRHIRHISAPNRHDQHAGGGDSLSCHIERADEDLINQNRSNKEYERKCKPCQNGFCYCFTSDSGDGGGGDCGADARAAHVRHPRRHQRKSEGSQRTQATATKENTRLSAPEIPPAHKSPRKVAVVPHKAIRPQTACSATASQLTAISRLETTTHDAPLIHIIQELRDNCVVSEVRVNRHKLHSPQRSRSLSAKPSPKKAHFKLDDVTAQATTKNQVSPNKHTHQQAALRAHAPSAPTLDQITELDTDDGFIYSSPLNTSSKSNDGLRPRHKAGGRLLQKRLSGSHVQLKPRNLNAPPPKPPRSTQGFNDKSSDSTLASTTPSVRAAEIIVDDFLRQHGVKMPTRSTAAAQRCNKSTQFNEVKSVVAARPEKRASFPIPASERRQHTQKTLPSCPSLSDIERVINGKQTSRHYGNNIRRAAVADKPVKEISIGWHEPKIQEMLNYDASPSRRKQFVSRSVQAEPQAHIGWQIPPKLNIDTVDGVGCHNFAANIEHKETPVKTRRDFSARKYKSTQKFLISEQWRNLSPWSHKRTPPNSGRTLPRKSNLKSASRTFLNNSKKKILRLVSPKKDNREPREFVARKTPLRSVGVQTSPEDSRAYENSLLPQSPPGSYQSAVQASQQFTSTTPPTQTSQDTPDSHFDFTRKIHSPPKKAPRVSQRRLNFPLNCASNSCLDDGDSVLLPKTYRSYHSDLDQDFTSSKMGYILGNIRAKLEASDQHAERTFQEIERREQQSVSFDCPDGPIRRQFLAQPSHQQPPHQQERNQTHRINRRHAEFERDPIYSEIEEESLHIAGSPQFDNATGIDHDPVEHNPEVLYARVNKLAKLKQTIVPTALGKILQDSFTQRLQKDVVDKPLPPIPVGAARYSDTSYTTTMYSTAPLPPPPITTCSSGSLYHCNSLNNIRVMEHHSPPKQNRNLSKSDLSLQRSEIFLENLCRSELIIGASPSPARLEKVDNKPEENANTSYASVPSEDIVESDTSTSVAASSNASLSYVLPHVSGEECSNTNAAGSNFGLDSIASPYTLNQSTPKQNRQQAQEYRARPQTFLTKDVPPTMTAPQSLNIAASYCSLHAASHSSLLNHSNSCPTTPHQPPPALPANNRPHYISLEAVYTCGRCGGHSSGHNASTPASDKSSNINDASTISRYKRLKNALRQSLRRSKNYVKAETTRLSTSLNAPASSLAIQNSENGHNQSYSPNSSIDLEALFPSSDDLPVTEQLAKAVSICRQLPDLEISAEMVEAERLLLYSTLRSETRNVQLKLVETQRKREQQPRRYFIDSMRLPIRADATQDLFFNYFYICTFECAGAISSTQSVECRRGEAIFHNCNIDFQCGAAEESEPEAPQVHCQIFMLRLRKVSTLSMEPNKRLVKLPAKLASSPTASASSSNSEKIVSRFRLHATFSLSAVDFQPYELVACAPNDTKCVCLRSSCSAITVPLIPRTKSSNLAKQLILSARAELRFPSRPYKGYLNVQDPHTLHNWNRRWCTLEGVHLRVWPDENEIAEQQLLCLDMSTSAQEAPLIAAPRELCARQRAFCLQCVIATTKAAENTVDNNAAAVFFAAETQEDLNIWLAQLNDVLRFIHKWCA